MKINPFIEKQKKVNLTKDIEAAQSHQKLLVDCFSTINPYGFSDSVKKTAACLKNQYDIISEYPYNNNFKNAIINYWADYATFTSNNIVLTNGAIDGLCKINVLFHRQDACVLGISPMYTDYIVNARTMGFSFRTVPLLKKDNYKFDADRMLDAISSDLSLIYIDVPNNPTGQVITKNELRLVLEKARACDICVVIDEALGDYVDLSASAAALLNKYENLIVVRSFSKGFGLPGLRAGYMLTSEYLKTYFDKISNGVVVSALTSMLAQSALSDTSYIANCREQFVKCKDAVIACANDRLNVAHTQNDCPVMLLWHSDTTINLAAEFASNGIRVCSGSEFEGLAANSARIRLPQHNKLEELLGALVKINRL